MGRRRQSYRIRRWGDSMAEDNPEPQYAKAHQAIGGYFCAFSALEQDLGETIKVILHLQEHEEARDVVVLNAGQKIDLVRSSAAVAKNADGSDVAKTWKDNADRALLPSLLRKMTKKKRMARSTKLSLPDRRSLLATPANVRSSGLSARCQMNDARCLSACWRLALFSRLVGGIETR